MANEKNTSASIEKQWLPSRDQLVQQAWLKPWASELRSPVLWRFQHEAVARGVAVGLLWAFLIPLAQMVVAVVHCVWWRAHIPTAAAMTMVTNPFTIGFWLWLAYQTGSFILGIQNPAPTSWDQWTWDLLWSYGGPIMLGMALFAVGTSALGYGMVLGVWRFKVWMKRQLRAQTAIKR
jgi:uncharacterized protein (DUF2062 family)